MCEYKAINSTKPKISIKETSQKKTYEWAKKKKQMKMCSKLVVIERRQSKIIIRYHFKSIRILKVKKKNRQSKCWKVCGETRT